MQQELVLDLQSRNLRGNRTPTADVTRRPRVLILIMIMIMQPLLRFPGTLPRRRHAMLFIRHNNPSTTGTSLFAVTGRLNRGLTALKERRQTIFLNTHVAAVTMIVVTMARLHWIIIRNVM